MGLHAQRLHNVSISGKWASRPATMLHNLTFNYYRLHAQPQSLHNVNISGLHAQPQRLHNGKFTSSQSACMM